MRLVSELARATGKVVHAKASCSATTTKEKTPGSTRGVFFLAAGVEGPFVLSSGIFLKVFFVVDQCQQAIGALNDVLLFLDALGD